MNQSAAGLSLRSCCHSGRYREEGKGGGDELEHRLGVLTNKNGKVVEHIYTGTERRPSAASIPVLDARVRWRGGSEQRTCVKVERLIRNLIVKQPKDMALMTTLCIGIEYVGLDDDESDGVGRQGASSRCSWKGLSFGPTRQD